MRRSKNYHAHDELNSAKVGQAVSIVESKPYSKLKTWKLVDAQAPVGGDEGGGILSAVTETVGNVVDRVKSAVGLG